ncbi:LysR family transcriptional regulator [Rhizobium sp. Leaf262]|uniref:LysR family transcriptional regulator n=1 Tax=Rhizobium sp. Leaf262 TaxID=1736312 RepID=UPI0009E67ADB|nr:LysR family transcriptional regulator [Rhizobium sp. Leaf262]
MPIPSAHNSLLNLLQFVRIVDAGSFAEAARRAGTSTSAMSKAVSRFEALHGVKLLHRTTRAISLTHDGEKLLDGARNLLRQAERLEADIGEAAASSSAGRVRLAAPGPFLRACIAPMLPAILKANPSLELEIKVDDTGLDLAAEGIDVAIRFGDLSGQPGLIARRLGTFPYVLAATPKYLEFMGTPKSPADLESHHQIGYRDAANGQLLPWLFCDNSGTGAVTRMVPRNRIVVEDMTVAWAMTLRGLGMSWLPAWCSAKEVHSGRAVEVLKDWRMQETPAYAVQLDRKQVPQRTRDLVNLMALRAKNWVYS